MSLEKILEVLLSFFLLWIVLLPLERLFPAKRQAIFRKEWWTDLLFFGGQAFVWGGLTVSALVLISDGCNAIIPIEWRQVVRSQPWWLQAVEVIFLGDLLVYWGHRLSHRVEFLWRFHSIHHSAERLDWLAAYREHPVDGLYTRLLTNLPAILFGFPLQTVVGFMVLRGLWAVFIHSNVRVPLGPLKYLLGAPSLHHWHHDVERGGHCNFANVIPIMDLIFGTYYEPDHEPERYGIDDPIPRDYFGQLISAFAPRGDAAQGASSTSSRDNTDEDAPSSSS